MIANRPNGTTDYSTSAVWSTVFHDLKDTDFSDDDIAEWAEGMSDRKIAAAYALQYAHEKMDNGSDGVLAVLQAAAAWRNTAFLSETDVADMADNFHGYFGSRDDALDEHLRELWNDMPITYLSDYGREELLKGMRRNNEIWIDSDELPGIWVFHKPDHR